MILDVLPTTKLRNHYPSTLSPPFLLPSTPHHYHSVTFQTPPYPCWFMFSVVDLRIEELTLTHKPVSFRHWAGWSGSEIAPRWSLDPISCKIHESALPPPNLTTFYQYNEVY